MSELGDNRPIGFFDSGVGGLTVLREALVELPEESYIYIGDTENIPYGTKSPELVETLATDVARTLLSKNVKALVVACNTISAVALPQIESLDRDVPVIGVIDPTVRNALAASANKSLAVIATETTIGSGIYEKKINEIGGGNHTVLSKATPAFVPLIEEKPHDHPLIDDSIKMYLEEIKNHPTIDTLILGCTHYPMIKEKIESYLGHRFRVIDSAQPTAAALRELLERENLLRYGGGTPTKVFFTSDDPRRAMRIAQEFLGGELELQKIKIKRES